MANRPVWRARVLRALQSAFMLVLSILPIPLVPFVALILKPTARNVPAMLKKKRKESPD